MAETNPFIQLPISCKTFPDEAALPKKGRVWVSTLSWIIMEYIPVDYVLSNQCKNSFPGNSHWSFVLLPAVQWDLHVATIFPWNKRGRNRPKTDLWRKEHILMPFQNNVISKLMPLTLNLFWALRCCHRREKREEKIQIKLTGSCWLDTFPTFNFHHKSTVFVEQKKQETDKWPRDVFTITQSLTAWKMSTDCLCNPKYVPYANSLKGRLKKELEKHGNRKR